jgi:hypothetical protein
LALATLVLKDPGNLDGVKGKSQPFGDLRRHHEVVVHEGDDSLGRPRGDGGRGGDRVLRLDRDSWAKPGDHPLGAGVKAARRENPENLSGIREPGPEIEREDRPGIVNDSNPARHRSRRGRRSPSRGARRRRPASMWRS